jgi:hypothetical protein
MSRYNPLIFLPCPDVTVFSGLANSAVAVSAAQRS